MPAIITSIKDLYIVGHSFGGNLALDATVNFGNAVSWLILFSPDIYLKYEKLIKIILPLCKRLFKFQLFNFFTADLPSILLGLADFSGLNLF